MRAAMPWCSCNSVERFDEGQAVDARPHGEDARGERPHARRRQPADKVFGEHGEAFLQRFVAREAGVKLPQRLLPAVEVREQVGADFVVQ